ncbi:hypothetical protein NEILACOT_03045 [Neisseria lactamica ATCC 23970]|uniref:Uncharacterized protein n=1 Tax=Neisseria lactamica ATCC 23970 TaxID=546265 RepID=D0W6A8_NEILA|nr:hypothetical protein NEILACOT_03045 [Neisseria lactamica ATCC 23970]
MSLPVFKCKSPGRRNIGSFGVFSFQCRLKAASAAKLPDGAKYS